MDFEVWVAIGTLIGLIILILLSVPIWFSLSAAALVGFLFVGGPTMLLEQFSTAVYSISANYSFAVIPLFILMSILASECGIAEACYETFSKWLGQFRGGILIATIMGAALFGACSGMSLASSAVFAKVAIPELKKNKYDVSLGTACIAISGALSDLIPPSVPIVIYCILLNLSIGKALVAGIVPGVLLAILLSLVVFIISIVKPAMMPQNVDRPSWRERFASLKLTGPVIIVIAAVVGGIYFGVFAPTIGGAFGSLAILIIAVIRGVKFKKIRGSFLETVLVNTQVYPMVIGGFLYARLISLSGLPTNLVEIITGANLPPFLLLLVVIIFYLIVGSILDFFSMLIITLPLLFPLLAASGFEPLAIMVCILILGGIAGLTPPIGMLVFVVSGVANVKPELVFRGIIPFFIACLAMVFLVAFMPQIAVWLPHLFYGG